MLGTPPLLMTQRQQKLVPSTMGNNALFFPERIGRLHGAGKARELPDQKGSVVVIEFLRGLSHQEPSGTIRIKTPSPTSR